MSDRNQSEQFERVHMSGSHQQNKPAGHECFAGSGEMAARMQSFDWSKTPLGPVECWPQSLKTTVRIMLTSRYAMWMAWGPDLTFFYNDAYTPTLGIKHAWASASRRRQSGPKSGPTSVRGSSGC